MEWGNLFDLLTFVEGFEFHLRRDVGGRYELVLTRPEWVSYELAQSRPLPTFTGFSPQEIWEGVKKYLEHDTRGTIGEARQEPIPDL